MNNTQKILLIVGIIAIIIILEVWLCGVIDKVVNNTLNELEDLKISLKEEKYEESKMKSQELNKKWFEYENKLLLFVEHEEVEKVTAKIVIILENASNEDYNGALEDLMETKYLLEHIKDKNKLQLKNIF